MADRLGFREIWFSEHQSPAELIIAKAAGRTKVSVWAPACVRSGTITPCRSRSRPTPPTSSPAGATCSHRHRLLSPQIGMARLRSRCDARGDGAVARADAQAVEQQRAGRLRRPVWKGKQMVLECPPVQKPHPPLAIAAANSVGSVELAGRLGLYVLTGDFIPVPRLRLFSDALVQAQVAAGRKPRRKDLRATRVIYVAESDKVARDDMRDATTRSSRGRSSTRRTIRSSGYRRAARSRTSISTTWWTPPTCSSAARRR